MKNKIKLIFASMIMLTTLFPFQYVNANGSIAERTATESCSWNESHIEYNRIISCSTGQFIRNDIVTVTNYRMGRVREYCDGGWGWCFISDAACPQDDVEIWHLLQVICENP